MTLEKTKKEVVSITEIIPVIKASIENGKPVEITVTGNSMKPLLKDRISSVKLIKPDNLKKGDIVLFLRNDNRYVLHRIVNVRDGLYDIVGDNQYVKDINISKDAIVAKVFEYSRDGKKWQRNDYLYQKILPVIKIFRYYGSKFKRKLGTTIK